MIILPFPPSGQYLSFLHSREDLTVEEFIPKFSIEALDVSVLPGAARLNEQSLDTQSREPLPDGFSHELGSVVRPDVFGDTVLQHQLCQRSEYIP